MKQKTTLEQRAEKKIISLQSTLRHYGIHVSRDYLRLVIKHIFLCEYCGKIMAVRDYSIDHIIPRARGGADDVDNIHYVCVDCNRAKGDLLDSEFRLLLKWLEDKPEMKKRILQRLKASGILYHHGG